MDVAMALAKLHVSLWVVPDDSISEPIISSYKTTLHNVLYQRPFKGVC
jgi:hypothetical protein